MEVNGLLKKLTISDALYRANLGFGFGIALGTMGSASSLASGILSGGLVHTMGFFAEVLPVLSCRKTVHMQFDETTGKQISF